MKTIIAAFTFFVFTGCEYHTPKVSQEVKFAYGELKVVEILGCEYLYGPWGNATILTHKGNCKFCNNMDKATITKLKNDADPEYAEYQRLKAKFDK